MNVSRIDGIKDDMNNAAQGMKTRMVELQESVELNLNKAMIATADGLENTAKKINETAEILREQNTQTLKDEASETIKKYPAYALLGAGLIGFMLGKILSR